MKWIFITGGVLSGLGKGLVSASVSKLLQSRGFSVIPIKCDGYLNVDPGTMNPFEHGEVFVLEDGGEVDMDFGHYERFLNIKTKSSWNLTSGKIFKAVIDNERRGKYLGKTVQIIPHVTDEIKRIFLNIAKSEGVEVVVVEIGGTVGDIENQIFLEAIRQMMRNLKDNTLLIHLTLVPYLNNAGELKTKPTQHSVKELDRAGLHPDVIICRSQRPLSNRLKEKISLFCGIQKENVISEVDVKNIYRIPILFEEQRLTEIVLDKLDLKSRTNTFSNWVELVSRMNSSSKDVKVAICGKYTRLKDSYISIIESLRHAAAHLNYSVNIKWLETTDASEEDIMDKLSHVDGIIVPGGFGSRGTEGKIRAIKIARESKKPLLGLCFGLQLMAIEYARHVCGLDGANSTEMDANTPIPIVCILPEQEYVREKGGTMRLGAEKTNIKEMTLAHEIYKKKEIWERFRHRYELNPEYYMILEKKGLTLSGRSSDNKIVQIIELPKKEHPFYFATQFHPEYTSSLENPSPVFKEFLKACGG